MQIARGQRKVDAHQDQNEDQEKIGAPSHGGEQSRRMAEMQRVSMGCMALFFTNAERQPSEKPGGSGRDQVVGPTSKGSQGRGVPNEAKQLDAPCWAGVGRGGVKTVDLMVKTEYAICQLGCSVSHILSAND
jgi:hypothetical protein